MIQKIIKDISDSTGLKVTAERSYKNNECIVYSFSKEYDNGAVAQYRLTINILTKTIAKSYEIKNIIDNLLITKGDLKKYDEINECVLGGGSGFMQDSNTSEYDTDTNMYRTINYYDMTCKSNIDWR